MPVRADATEELCRAGHHGAPSGAGRDLKLDLGPWDGVFAVLFKPGWRRASPSSDCRSATSWSESSRGRGSRTSVSLQKRMWKEGDLNHCLGRSSAGSREDGEVQSRGMKRWVWASAGASVNSTLRSAVGLGCCPWHPELAAGSEGRGAASARAGILSRVRVRRWWGWWRSPVLAEAGMLQLSWQRGRPVEPEPVTQLFGWRGVVQGWVCSPSLPLGPGASPYPKIVIKKLTNPPIFQQKDPGEKHWVSHRKKHLWVKKCVQTRCREHAAKPEMPAASCLPLPRAKILLAG